MRRLPLHCGVRLCLACLGCWAGNAGAFDGFAVDAGNGNDGVKIVRLSAQIRQWSREQEQENHAARSGLHWELGVAWWEAEERARVTGLYEANATPVYRFSLADPVPGLFVDLGIGVHALSEHRIGERELGSQYHFGSFIGLGLMPGDRRYNLSLRLQHLSNAGVELPNPGINFLLLRFGVRH